MAMNSPCSNCETSPMSRHRKDFDQFAPQEVRRRFRDQRSCQRARTQWSVAREVHQLVLHSSTGKDLRVSLRRSFDDHLFRAANSGHVLRERRTFDDDAQSLEAITDFDWVAELIDHVGRFCPFAWREDEGVRGVIFRSSSNFECAFEILFGFAGVPHDDVGRNRKIGNSGTGRYEFFEVTLRGVAAMHQGEHSVAT